MINLEIYRVFVVVASEKDLLKSSNMLHISQSTILRNIKELESILGFKLFRKTDQGLNLTKNGNELYQKLKDPIKEIMYIDNQYCSIKNINIGSHNHLLNKIFKNCINKFCLKYPKVQLDFQNLETAEMLEMLTNRELDIVFSKKVANLNNLDINFIQLGYLNDIFIINKNFKLHNKILSMDDLKNKTIYVPRLYSQSVNRFLNFMGNNKLKLKCSNYNNILGLVSSSSSIALLTKEYLNRGLLKKYNLAPVKTELNLPPIEFGIYYLKNNRFKELNDLIQVIKTHFFFKEFDDD